MQVQPVIQSPRYPAPAAMHVPAADVPAAHGQAHALQRRHSDGHCRVCGRVALDIEATRALQSAPPAQRLLAFVDDALELMAMQCGVFKKLARLIELGASQEMVKDLFVSLAHQLSDIRTNVATMREKTKQWDDRHRHHVASALGLSMIPLQTVIALAGCCMGKASARELKDNIAVMQRAITSAAEHLRSARVVLAALVEKASVAAR